jgi:phosphoglycerate dehydrogenase-like enzyme
MRVLVTSTHYLPPEVMAEFRSTFPQVEFSIAVTPEEAIKAAPDAEVVFGHVTTEVFQAAKKVRWIQSMGAGVEWLARVPAVVESDVIVTNTRGAHASTIAEHAFGMLISLARQFRQLDAAQRAKTWLRDTTPPQVGLSGMTLGVIGLGNIGRAIAKRGAAFDMKVMAVDANDVPQPEYVAELGHLAGLPDLLRQSDAVVVAVPITPETRGMLGAAQLAMMKPAAFLIVISRGGIVEQEALSAALKAGRLAGAGLDVCVPEPLPPTSGFWETPNLILTPHCSGYSTQTTQGVIKTCWDNLKLYLAGQPVGNVVDKRRGY